MIQVVAKLNIFGECIQCYNKMLRLNRSMLQVQKNIVLKSLPVCL